MQVLLGPPWRRRENTEGGLGVCPDWIPLLFLHPDLRLAGDAPRAALRERRKAAKAAAPLPKGEGRRAVLPARALGPSPTCIWDTLTDPAEPKCALTGVGASCWEAVSYSTWSSAERLLQLLLPSASSSPFSCQNFT